MTPNGPRSMWAGMPAARTALSGVAVTLTLARPGPKARAWLVRILTTQGDAAGTVHSGGERLAERRPGHHVGEGPERGVPLRLGAGHGADGIYRHQLRPVLLKGAVAMDQIFPEVGSGRLVTQLVTQGTKEGHVRRSDMASELVGDTGFEPVTSSVSRKRAPTAPIARGGCGNRTRVQGFAGPCLSHSANPPDVPCGAGSAAEPPQRADDGIRTRDPHLGKVMRYQLRYVRVPPAYTGDGCRTLAHPLRRAKPVPGASRRRPRSLGGLGLTTRPRSRPERRGSTAAEPSQACGRVGEAGAPAQAGVLRRRSAPPPRRWTGSAGRSCGRCRRAGTRSW